MAVEAIGWLVVGGAAAYILLGKVNEPEEVEVIRPPPKFMYQSPQTNFAKLSSGMEFYDIKQTGTDQYGIPIEYWSTSPGGTSVRLFGSANAPRLQRFPAQVSAMNNAGKKKCACKPVRPQIEHLPPNRVHNLNEPNIASGHDKQLT